MKKLRFTSALALALAGVATFTPIALRAGTEIEAVPDKDKIVVPVKNELPMGTVTVGGKFSSGLESGYVDSLTPFWAPGGVVLFLDTRTNYSDDHQTISSYGLGARYLVPDQEVIFGANAFYDSVNSRFGNDFSQLGLGAELLTRWVDTRFNYYLPDSAKYEINRDVDQSTDRQVGPIVPRLVSPRHLVLQQQVFKTVNRRTTREFEAALEGWNAEAGFLIPGLDKYMEVRLFAGAYHYNNPFGHDFTGFKSRLEARLLPGVIADVEYWDNAFMTGGHWTGELSVTVPFSIYNLATGRNPFEGISDMFRPRQREFRERLSDMVERSHRIYTASGDPPNQTTDTQSTSQTTVTEGNIFLQPPVKKVAPPKPPPGEL
jgi:hypothetical protein